ncbi:hypothetical protein [Methylophilus methylotrophus]|uniref:hypothetical protein n=1 Tax=Methylophilus methylotrophus TaxID=17 RepID=UPI0012B548E1|nr:hypothetical protein [Methylophilus methylotrophus]
MMKTHFVIVSSMMALGYMSQAIASDRVFIKYAIDSPQMQNLSKRPYQQPRPASVGTDAALKDAALRGYELQSQNASKLHAISKRSY